MEIIEGLGTFCNDDGVLRASTTTTVPEQSSTACACRVVRESWVAGRAADKRALQQAGAGMGGGRG